MSTHILSEHAIINVQNTATLYNESIKYKGRVPNSKWVTIVLTMAKAKSNRDWIRSLSQTPVMFMIADDEGDGIDRVELRLREEQLVHNDLLFVDYKEQYGGYMNSPVRKLWCAFHAILHHAPSVQYIRKIDHDIWSEFSWIKKEVENLPSPIYYGTILKNMSVLRDPSHKNYISKSVFQKDTFAPFASGHVYVLDRTSVKMMYAFQRPPLLEDVYIGEIASELNIKPQHGLFLMSEVNHIQHRETQKIFPFYWHYGPSAPRIDSSVDKIHYLGESMSRVNIYLDTTKKSRDVYRSKHTNVLFVLGVTNKSYDFIRTVNRLHEELMQHKDMIIINSIKPKKILEKILEKENITALSVVTHKQLVGITYTNKLGSAVNQHTLFMYDCINKTDKWQPILLSKDGTEGTIQVFDKMYQSRHTINYTDLSAVIESSQMVPRKFKEIYPNIHVIYFNQGPEYFITHSNLVKNKTSPTYEAYHTVDTLWTTAQYNWQAEFLTWFERAKQHRPAPYVWDPYIMMNKHNNSSKFTPNYRRVGVYETNRGIYKMSLVPMLLVEDMNDKYHNLVDYAESVALGNLYTSVFRNDLMPKFKLDWHLQQNMVRLPQQWHEHEIGTVVSHTLNNGLNYLWLEAIYKGLALVHNSKHLPKGCGYYYPDENITAGAEALRRAIQTHNEMEAERHRQLCLPAFSTSNPDNIAWYERLLEQIH